MATFTEDLNQEFSFPLSFDVKFDELKEEDVDKVKSLRGAHPFFNATNFTIPESIHIVVNDVGLTIDPLKSFLFKLDPFDTGPIHLDGDPTLNKLRKCGMNFSWGNEDTCMQWFVNKNPTTTSLYAGIVLPHFDPVTTKMLYSTKLKGGNLVHLEYPHRVRSLSQSLRISLSIGFKEDISWSDLKTQFSNHGYAVQNTLTRE